MLEEKVNWLPWWIIESNVKKPTKIMDSSVTDKAILSGFKNLKDGNYKKIYIIRQKLERPDWFVGINATRALNL